MQENLKYRTLINQGYLYAGLKPEGVKNKAGASGRETP
jgi:hypothetical protein